jgi:hypothetical protein
METIPKWVLETSFTRQWFPLLELLNIDDIFTEGGSALEADEGHNLSNAILLGCTHLFRTIQLLRTHRLSGFASASCTSTSACGIQPSEGVFADDITLKLGQDGHYVEHELPSGSRRIYVFFEASQFNPTLRQCLYGFDEVFQGTPEAVKSPDDNDIASTRDIEQAQKFGTVKAHGMLP